jgi:tetratricopeptide (TPR) repeat protein
MDQARSKVDKVAAYRLRILLHLLQGEYQPAVDRGLECLRIFGIDLPAHPTREQVNAEYEKIWRNLDCYYSALTAAALCETAGAERHFAMLGLLEQSLKWLREWAESCPDTFLDRYTLALAELVRVEGRELDAMRLYEEAICATRDHGLCKMRQSLTSWRPGFTSSGATRRLPKPTFELRATATLLGSKG